MINTNVHLNSNLFAKFKLTMCSMTIFRNKGSVRTLRKKCRVCGDVAIGFNFNGLSCESCKAFFRRSALRNKVLYCSTNGKCIIDPCSRKYCKKCRLQKCLQIGMKKELILCFKYEQAKCKLSLENQFLLGVYDLERLHEVEKAKFCFINENKLELIPHQANALVDVMNLADNYVSKVIKYCKTYSNFKCLNSSDQLSVLKQFFPEACLIGASFLFDSQKDGLPAIFDTTESKVIFVNLEHWSTFLKNKKLVARFRSFLNRMHLEMEKDCTIRDLILAQLLFVPRGNLSCQEFLSYNHSLYCHLLYRYLLNKFGSLLKAQVKYCSLMLLVNRQLGVISNILCEIYQNEVDCTKVAKALAEIYL